MEKLIAILSTKNNLAIGTEAHIRIFPNLKLQREFQENLVASAVMACLVQHEGKACMVFIRRTNHGKHANQIAFPGGKKESQDTDLWDTAVRECEEEINLQGAVCLAKLSPVSISVSGYIVYPFLAYDPSPQTLLVADPSEVAEVMYMPIENLKKLQISEEEVQSYSGKMRAKGFRWGADFIWGATAMMLSEIQIILQNAKV